MVVQDPDIVQAAKRNSEGIVPLYYQMAKAGAQPITKDNIYNSMILAYVGGNIGQISNDISIIWNTEDCGNRLEAVKLLCMENNFTIDQWSPRSGMGGCASGELGNPRCVGNTMLTGEAKILCYFDIWEVNLWNL